MRQPFSSLRACRRAPIAKRAPFRMPFFCWCEKRVFFSRPYAPMALPLGQAGSDTPPGCHSLPPASSPSYINVKRAPFRMPFCCWCEKRDFFSRPYAPMALPLGQVGSDTPPGCHSLPTASSPSYINVKRAPFRMPFCCWCEKRDLNPYGKIHTPLKRARLPVPPLSRSNGYIILNARGIVKPF